MTVAAASRLEHAHVEQAAATLARAFFDYPLFTYTEPDDERRTGFLAWFMGGHTRYGHAHGDVFVAGRDSSVCAVWHRPDRPSPDPADLAAAGVDDLSGRLGKEAFERFTRAVAPLQELRTRDVPAPHWYLGLLGVDPPYQGQGLGGLAIAPMLARADTEAMPCYLATHKEINLLFYARHGFEEASSGVINGLAYWTMTRHVQETAQQ